MRTFGVLVAVLAAVGCGGDDSGELAADGRAVCASVVLWEGVVYSGHAVDKPTVVGDRLGDGLRPGCRDTVPADPGVKDESVEVVEVKGVRSTVAVGVAGNDAIFLAPGYQLASPKHPLYDVLAGTPWELEAGFACEAPVAMRAYALNTPGLEVFRVDTRDEAGKALLRRHDGTVFTDAQTAFRGLERDGIPYVREGDEFDLVVRACAGAEGERLLLAKSLTR